MYGITIALAKTVDFREGTYIINEACSYWQSKEYREHLGLPQAYTIGVSKECALAIYVYEIDRCQQECLALYLLSVRKADYCVPGSPSSTRRWHKKLWLGPPPVPNLRGSSCLRRISLFY